MASVIKLTIADLEALPENGNRYELIDGELHVSTAPHWFHQRACARFLINLETWNERAGLGVVNFGPGVIFTEENAVIPDIVWISQERLSVVLDQEKGKAYRAPDLVIEVLSPGFENERRDKRLKLQLYSRHGVKGYWIADWRAKTIEVYRRVEAALRLECTLEVEDDLTSPLLPGFSVRVATLFE
jgi:Uma2 family endonuclease